MATKTLTITEDAYNLLAENKLENESFSREIKRILLEKRIKKLSNFFGILSEKEGEGMLEDLKKIKSMNINMIKRRLT